MAFELTRRTTTDQGSGGQTTTQNEQQNGDNSSQENRQQITDEGPVQTISQETRTAATTAQTATEDYGIKLSFTIRLQNDQPVLPPGETAPASDC